MSSRAGRLTEGTRQQLLRHLLLTAAALAFLAPFGWLVMTAFTPEDELLATHGVGLPEQVTLENFGAALRLPQFDRHFFNTVGVTAVRVAGQVILSTLGGFALAHTNPPGGRYIGAVALTAFALPSILPLVSWAMLVRMSGFSNSYTALVLPMVVSSAGLLYFRRAFRELPPVLLEAALVDGVSAWQSFWHIALPHVRAQVVVFGCFVALVSWSEYLWALLSENEPAHRMLSVAIRLFVGQRGTNDLGVRTAKAVLAVLPMVVVLVVGLRSADSIMRQSAEEST